MTRAPELCKGLCGRYVRPDGTTSEQWPGTMRWRARGMCEPCARVAVPATSKPRFRPCLECGCMTRPKAVPLAAQPDTRIRVGDLCKPCSEGGGLVTPERVAYIRRELAAYFRSRGRTTELV